MTVCTIGVASPAVTWATVSTGLHLACLPTSKGVPCSQGFPDAERFDPDRFSEERKEDIVHGRNFLTFGFGPHGCVGREYAINHLVRAAAHGMRGAAQAAS